MPNRVIKDSIKSSAQIDSLTWFEEVVFYRLMVSADDFGCYDGRSVYLKNALFPTKDNVTKKAIEDAIQRLASVGLLQKYEVNGMPYLFFPTWEKHQRIRNKKRKYPAPPVDGHLTANCGQMTASCLSESESNPNPIQSESESNPTRAGAAASVCADFLDRVNPSASQASLDELSSYTETLGEAVCKRAIDIALDSKKATWPYIRGILRRLQAQGVKCLADWDAIEGKRDAKNMPKSQEDQEKETREDMDRMRRLLDRMKEADA